jgi:hypothetical protein
MVFWRQKISIAWLKKNQKSNEAYGNYVRVRNFKRPQNRPNIDSWTRERERKKEIERMTMSLQFNPLFRSRQLQYANTDIPIRGSHLEKVGWPSVFRRMHSPLYETDCRYRIKQFGLSKC